VGSCAAAEVTDVAHTLFANLIPNA